MRIALVAALIALSSSTANATELDALYLQGRDAMHAGNGERGIPLLRQAAIGGHATAQEHLGFLYGTEAYSPEDPEELVAWLVERSAEGDPLVQLRLGRFYWDGILVDERPERGLELIAAAAENGLIEAQAELGLIYGKGPSKWKDAETSAKWYRMAADAGHAESQFEYGLRLNKGKGVTRDQARALVYFTLAANQGYVKAAERAEKVKEKLSPETVLAADNVVKGWTSSRPMEPIEIKPGIFLAGIGGVSTPQVVYEDEFETHGSGGFVLMDLTIGKSGKITNSELIRTSGDAVAFQAWRWLSSQAAEPAVYRGTPIPVVYRLAYYWSAQPLPPGYQSRGMGYYGGPGNQYMAQKMYRARAGHNIP